MLNSVSEKDALSETDQRADRLEVWWAKWWQFLVAPIAACGLLLLGLWANSIWTSVDQYLNPASAAGSSLGTVDTEDIVIRVALVVCGWWTFLVVRGFWGPADRSAPWLTGVGLRRRFFGAAGIWAIGSALGIVFRAFAAGSSEGEDSISVGWASWAFVRPILFAGLTEEVFFSALAVLVGLRLRINFVVVIVISALLRGALHMYQGLWPAVGAVLWGALAVFAYYRYRSVMGLVVAHSIYNLAVAAGWAGQRWLEVAAAAVFVGAAVVYVVSCEGSRERPRSGTGVEVGSELSG